MIEKESIINHWKAWVVALLVTVLCLPMIADYFASVGSRPYYRLWPLLAVVIAVMFVIRWRLAPKVESYPPRWILWLMFLLALGLMLFALLY